MPPPPSKLMARMWYGPPLIEPEPLPRPQVPDVPLERCPPQKKPTLALATRGVNVTVIETSLSPASDPENEYPLNDTLPTLYAYS